MKSKAKIYYKDISCCNCNRKLVAYMKSPQTLVDNRGVIVAGNSEINTTKQT